MAQNNIDNRRVFAIGEALLDIVFKDGIPLKAIPGGSMLNTITSCARYGLNSFFISEYSNDYVGKIIDAFLIENSIKNNFIYKYSDKKTPIALAFLDEQNNANYQFYSEKSSRHLDILMPDFSSNDILIFGSYYALANESFHAVNKIVRSAKEAGALIIYDPNIRANKLKGNSWKEFLKENLLITDIVKASDEDLSFMFEKDFVIKEALREFDLKLVIITCGKNPVKVFSNNNTYSVEVPQIIPISTIGAGDAFSAGLVASLLENNIYLKELIGLNDSEIIMQIATQCIGFASKVCMKTENYI